MKYIIFVSLQLLIFCFSSKANTYSLAEVAFHRNHFYQAEVYFRKALRKSEKNKLKNQAAYIANRLGETLRIVGKESEAEQTLLQNLKLIQALPHHQVLLADCYDVLGELRYYISDIVTAGQYFRKSLEIKERELKENDADLAFSYSNMGRYYNYTQQLDSAIIYTKKAYVIIHHHSINHSHVNYERIYSEYAYALKEKEGRNKTAAWYQNAVRPVLVEGIKYNHEQYHEANYWLAMLMHSLGNTYTDELDTTTLFRHQVTKAERTIFYEKALTCYRGAVNIYRRILPENNPRLSMTYYVIGLAHTYYGASPVLTLKSYQKAVKQIIPQTTAAAYLSLPSSGHMPYNIHQYLALISYKIDALESLSNHAKTDTYDKSIILHTDRLIEIWAELIKRYQLNKQKDISTYYYKPPYETALNSCFKLYRRTGNRYYLDKALYYIEISKYTSFFKQKLATASSVDVFLKSTVVQPLSIPKLKRALSADEALVEIYDGVHVCFMLAITKCGLHLHKFPVSNKDVNDFSLLSKNISHASFSDFKRVAFKAYILFGLNNLLYKSVKRIHIVPGILYSYSIPFSELISTVRGDRYKTLNYLLYKYQFRYDLSLLIQQQFQQCKIKSNRLAILYAVPQYMSELPFTGRMVNDLKKNYHAQLVSGSNTIGRILQQVNNSGTLHIATHTIVDEVNPDKSYIAVANQKLFLADVYKYQLHVNLLNLGSCETAVGKSGYDNGSVFNFVRAFTYTGASAITSTLWKVDDEMTSMLYRDFYKNLSRNEDKATALYHAKIKYLRAAKNDAANPYYWAGIVLYGNPSPISIN